MTSHTPEMLAKARESAAAWWEARHNARRLANQIRDGLQDHQAEVQIALAALTAARDERAGGWQSMDSAPHACHVLATRWDDDACEWLMDVVASPPSKPFTHWRPLPPPPSTDGKANDGDV